MSKKLLAIVFFPLCAVAQWPGSHEGVALDGEIRSARPDGASQLYVDLRPVDGLGAGDRAITDSQGHFHFENLPPGEYKLSVLVTPGSEPSYEQQLHVNSSSGPLTVDLPERPESKPISGVVSLRQLQNPPPKKAMRAFVEAQQFSQAHNAAKAIEKLQQAIQIDPSFREAQLNLGAQYARLGRYQEAMTHLQSALDIGPPDAKAYCNLAFCYVKLGQLREAETLAKKALALDPNSVPAQTILRAISMP